MPKNAQTTAQLHSFHTLVMLKILQARLQQYMKKVTKHFMSGEIMYIIYIKNEIMLNFYIKL